MFPLGGNSRMQMASVVTTFLGKSAISGSFSTLYLFTPELYPTNLRYIRFNKYHLRLFLLSAQRGFRITYFKNQ